MQYSQEQRAHSNAKRKKSASCKESESESAPNRDERERAPLTSLHIGISPVLDRVFFALVGNLLGEVVVSVVAFEPAREEGHDVEEVGVVDLDGDVAVREKSERENIGREG